MKSMSTKEEHRAFVLTRRFIQAVDYARQIHTGWRKGTHVPYMAHLLGVASLVMGESGHVPFAVTEDMVIAALLHDAVEDEGGLPRLQDIEAKFGKDVAKIVKGAAPIGPKLTATRNRNGECGRKRTLSGCARNLTSRKERCSSQQQTSRTTPAQSLRITGRSERRSGSGPREGATSNFGTSTSSSRCTKNGAGAGGSWKNSNDPPVPAPFFVNLDELVEVPKLLVAPSLEPLPDLRSSR